MRPIFFFFGCFLLCFVFFGVFGVDNARGVISWCSSCVLAHRLPERSAALPAAETPLPWPLAPTPAPARGLHHWAGERGLLACPGAGGQEGEAGARAAG